MIFTYRIDVLLSESLVTFAKRSSTSAGRVGASWSVFQLETIGDEFTDAHFSELFSCALEALFVLLAD